ncbi:MAG: NAD(P)-dependent oxidoreductase [Gemmatimonadota bacterium]
MRELPARDFQHVLDHARHVWDDYRDARIFITGVTGFVGSWMLETVLHAERTLKLGLTVTALVRDHDAFTARFPHLAALPALRLHVGDVRTVEPPTHAFSHFVHCASAATPQMNADRPEEVVDIIVNGSGRMIEAAEAGNEARFLQVSSGAVYGPQPAALAQLRETYGARASRDEPSQRFGWAKHQSELRGNASVSKGLGFVSARGFALIGPRLPLAGPFAIGNFLGDILAGRTVAIAGDGSPVRSWMHAADLAVWNWTILARGRPGAAYNVGSEEALTLCDAAHRVAALAEPPVAVMRATEPSPGAVTSRYVPSTELARDEMGLETWIPFGDALQRTWEWLRA